jgi:hypothetical protein
MEMPNQHVKLVPTDSEGFEAVGYDASARCMIMKLRDGTTIRLENVPRFRYSGLLSSPRKDAYYRAFIKGHFLTKNV